MLLPPACSCTDESVVQDYTHPEHNHLSAQAEQQPPLYPSTQRAAALSDSAAHAPVTCCQISRMERSFEALAAMQSATGRGLGELSERQERQLNCRCWWITHCLLWATCGY
jgi:hypothetical protein